MPWRRAITAAVVVTLVRPAGWVVALAGFLAGGGLLLAAWPVVVLPTPTGLQNLLAVPVSTLVFGSPSPGLVTLVAATGVAAAVLVAAGLVAGSWAERRLALDAMATAAEEGYCDASGAGGSAACAVAPGTPSTPGTPGTLKVALLRAVSLVPPALVFAAVWSTVYNVTYRELILPEELATPLPIRVIARLPVPLLALAVTWLAADTAASAGVRRLVLERRGWLAAWALGWADLLRRPVRLLGLALLGIVGQILAFAPALAAASIGWGMLRATLEAGRDLPIQLAMTATWVAIWLAALALASVGAAFRLALATFAATPMVLAAPPVTPLAADTSG